MLTVGSLFSGIGGMDAGLEAAGMRVLWQCEIDRYARETVLVRHWPDVPCFEDARLVDWTAVTRPDVLAAGFPCTDLSNAGEQNGIDGDTRSGITWRELVRCTDALRPPYILIENVPALLSGDGGRWFSTVLGTLAARGYDAEWDHIPASSLGADHRRDRVWIIAYPAGVGREKPRIFGPHAKHYITPRKWQTTDAVDAIRRGAVPALCRSNDGIRHRMDRMRGLGNAVCPYVAEAVGRMILHHAAA